MNTKNQSSEQQFVEFTFGLEELRKMPKQHSAYMVATSFAINEILVYLRLALLTLNSLSVAKNNDEKLAGFAFMQDQILLRTLSARAVEYLKLLKDHQKVCQRAKDGQGLAFFEEHGATLDSLWNNPTTTLALELRNNLTGHIGLDRIRKNISRLDGDKRETAIFLHQKDGNSVYLMGEDIAHIAAFDTAEDVQAWSDWVLATCQSIKGLHHAYMIWVIETFFPTKMGQELRLRPDVRLLGNFQDRIPILWDFPHKSE